MILLNILIAIVLVQAALFALGGAFYIAYWLHCLAHRVYTLLKR